MLDRLLRILVNSLLWLRYRIRMTGAREAAAGGTRGILFLPNHPALIDPIILLAHLHKRFRPRVLALRHQIDRFFIRTLARRVGAVPIPDLDREGPGAREEMTAAVSKCVELLRSGENLVLYPSGHAYRSRLENLRGNSAVETILRKVPDARVVLVRTTGLWGSRFSWATGRPPQVARGVKRAVPFLLRNFLLFAPRRHVNIKLHEPDDLPRHADRNTLNAYLEAWYNRDAPANTYVPYSIWERGRRRALPDPPLAAAEGDPSAVPQSVRTVVIDRLRELTGEEALVDDAELARDLGLDSLARAELGTWLESEFGHPTATIDAMRTVGDVMLSACGRLVAPEPMELKEIPRRWFGPQGDAGRAGVPPGGTIPQVVLAQVRGRPGRPLFADQTSGVRTGRDLLTALLALMRPVTNLPGDRLGIMLPASVAAAVSYLAALFAGKTPVMVNWTVGRRHLLHSLEAVGVRAIVTSRRLVQRLEGHGVDFADLRERSVFLEDLAAGLTRRRKLRAWLGARLGARALHRAAGRVRPSDTAAILFTSGSETVPKAVPLTHANILSNVRDIARALTVRRSDAMLSLLPPFHSFGLTVNIVTPACLGIRSMFHPDPTAGATLARIAEAYRATLLVGTPTFLGRIVGAARPGDLDTLRLAVTGAEACPRRLCDELAGECPGLTVLEGYGVTECSPIVSVNNERDPKAMTIGKVLPSLEYAVVHPETGQRVQPGDPGVLLVRGPSVFGGYLGEARSPFVEFGGRRWYGTGDLVSEDADGVLTFRGRLKRFVKIGGEMVSLPAIEAALAERFPPDSQGRPTVAVAAAGAEGHPELVLFTTRQIDRPAANAVLREAGLSPLHHVHRVVRMTELPLLGTGKVDHRALNGTPECRRVADQIERPGTDRQ